MRKYGFKQSNSDHTLFLKRKGKLVACLIIYVDDMIITGNDEEEMTRLRTNLFKEFKMKDLKRLKHFLGIEVLRSKQGIFICQKKYVIDLLVETGMIDYKPVDTPMMVNQKLYMEKKAKLADKGRDELRWELGNDATFTVKETREHIDDNILQTLDAPTIWCKSISRKVNIFLWRLRLDRLPTRLNLSKRGLDIPSIMCLIWSNCVESNDHIFYSCEVAASIWRIVDVWCDMHFPNMLSPSAWISWLDTLRTLNDYRNRIQVIVTTTLWTIWKYRNSVTINS
nr:putative ribonuclease H-like domain-containing protein [Tanacetum cinerariifolium]